MALRFMYSLFLDLAAVELGDPIHLPTPLLLGQVAAGQQPIIREFVEKLLHPVGQLAAIFPAGDGLVESAVGYGHGEGQRLREEHLHWNLKYFAVLFEEADAVLRLGADQFFEQSELALRYLCLRIRKYRWASITRACHCMYWNGRRSGRCVV